MQRWKRNHDRIQRWFPYVSWYRTVSTSSLDREGNEHMDRDGQTGEEKDRVDRSNVFFHLPVARWVIM